MNIGTKERASALVGMTVLLVGLSCLTLIGFDVWRCLSERSVQLREVHASVRNLAKAMQIHAQNAIDEADLVLVGVVERIETDGTGPAVLARTERLMKLRKQALPQLDGLFVFDREGRWLAFSQPALVANANNADRDYFIRHERDAAAGLLIGAPVRSRSTGHLVIPLTRAINAPDGSFAGVALAMLRVDYFTRFYDELDIGHDGAVALAATEGYLLARRPFSPSYVGKSLAGSQLLETVRKYGTGVTKEIRSAQDGVVRLNSIMRVGDYPLFVGAAMSKDESLVEWRSNTIVHVVCDLGFVLLLTLLGLQLARRVRETERARAQLVDAHEALERLNRDLERQALSDGLTGLANRRHFDMRLAHECAMAAQQGTPLALLLIDIDHFKYYNDEFGHQSGDACLQRVAATIRSFETDPSCVAARYGGEELALILPGIDGLAASGIADKVREAVAALGIPNPRTGRAALTVSIGVANFRANDTPRELIARSDAALYNAKSCGRDAVRLAA
ncbi:sensor domain-containing diguanylate cyclase [Chitinasiproducens palmae]|nr:sensor domain-containing diguanylate cyclase [Chitinasiproducens palmae]